jgi:PIN like domain
LKFFFDNTTTPRLVAALRALEGGEGHKLEHLRERFAPDTPDVNWIRTLGTEGDWVIISGDVRISQNQFERRAWLESGLTAFFLGKGWTTLKLWMRWTPKFRQLAKVNPAL